MDEALDTSDSESEPLLYQSRTPKVPWLRTFRGRLIRRVNFLPRQLCLPSKAAVLILFWTVVVSTIHGTLTTGVGYAAQILSYKLHMPDHPDTNEKTFIAYSTFALASLIYPFAGFVADVHIGRYKAVVTSLLFLLVAFLFLSVDSVLYLTNVVKSDPNDVNIVQNLIPFLVLGMAGCLFSVIGLAGYQANYIQFGLDQLLEAPSEYQGLFVHWVQWFTMLGYMFIGILFAWYSCHYEECTKDTILTLPMVFVSTLALLLFITFYLRKTFYARNVRHNPYRMVFKVLNFARRHKYPLQGSAFTYCDDEHPTRIDFAKDRYGGPFTTEQVEDVKTFFRILIVLVVLGPVFVLDIPSDAVFTMFAQHFTINRDNSAHNCTLIWAALDTGALKYVTAVLFFMAYIWLVYSLLRNCIPKIFVRLWVAHFLFVLGAVSMLVLDIVGHLIYYNREHKGAVCMFYSEVQNSHEMELGLHWGVLILPNILVGIAPLLIMTNAFEFISAQSPHSMTGLFIGLFLAIRGFFQFIGSFVLYPLFSIDNFWKNSQPVLTCGFGYLLFGCVVGLLSLTFLTIVSKRYKYRERNDPPYNHMHVERVFKDYISNN